MVTDQKRRSSRSLGTANTREGHTKGDTRRIDDELRAPGREETWTACGRVRAERAPADTRTGRPTRIPSRRSGRTQWAMNRNHGFILGA